MTKRNSAGDFLNEYVFTGYYINEETDDRSQKTEDRNQSTEVRGLHWLILISAILYLLISQCSLCTLCTLW